MATMPHHVATPPPEPEVETFEFQGRTVEIVHHTNRARTHDNLKWLYSELIRDAHQRSDHQEAA